MQPDLVGLEFTKGELRRLTKVDPDNVFRATIFQDREKRLRFLLNEILICFVFSTIIVGVVYTFIVIYTVGSSIQLVIALLIVVSIAVAAGRWLWRKKAYPEMLTALLNEVDKYQDVIKEIDINDSLKTDKTKVSLRDRSLVIEALQLSREDLVRALKAERMLRDNKDAIAINSDISNNLSALRAMQVSSQASEYERMLNEVLQISVSVQEKMRKLQGQRSN